MEIHQIKIEKLIPYAQNAKKHPESQINQVADSIKAFGWKQPIVIDRGNTIVIGHCRLLAAKQLGCDAVPCIIADDLTESQIRALRLADNKTNESEWDFDMLGVELDSLLDVDIDMSVFGFEGDIFENETNSGEVVEDDFDIETAVPDEPVSKMGDIWRLGRHRLMCGDSTDSESVALLMDGSKADIVFTDPPYFSFGSSSGAKSSNKDMGMVKPFFRDVIKTISQNLKYRHGAFICCDWRTYPLFYEIVNEYMNVRNCVVWDTEMLKMGVYFRSMHEFIAYCTNDNKDEKAVGISSKRGKLVEIKKDISNVWRISDNNFSSKNKIHSSQKPLDLCIKAIDCYIEQQATVLDLFGGSGSTLVACEQLNRVCYMMELDPKYCDVIISRWEKFTGRKATLETSKRIQLE